MFCPSSSACLLCAGLIPLYKESPGKATGASPAGARSRNGDFPSPAGMVLPSSLPLIAGVWQGYGIAHSMQMPVKRRGPRGMAPQRAGEACGHLAACVPGCGPLHSDGGGTKSHGEAACDNSSPFYCFCSVVQWETRFTVLFVIKDI